MPSLPKKAKENAPPLTLSSVAPATLPATGERSRRLKSHAAIIARIATAGVGDGLGVAVGVATPTVREADGVVLAPAAVGERDGVGDGVADGDSVPPALREGVGEGVALAPAAIGEQDGERDGERDGVVVGERVGVGDDVDDGVREGVTEGVALVVDEHDGAAAMPAVAQPPHGHAVGQPDPAGQKEPTGQMIAVAFVEPAGQK